MAARATHGKNTNGLIPLTIQAQMDSMNAEVFGNVRIEMQEVARNAIVVAVKVARYRVHE